MKVSVLRFALKIPNSVSTSVYCTSITVWLQTCLNRDCSDYGLIADMSKSRLFRRRMQRRRTLADAVLADTTGAREDSLGITKAKTKDCGVTPKSMAMHATTGPQGSMAPRVSASGSSKSPKLLAMEIKRGLSKHRSSSESALLVLQRPKTGTPEDTSPTYRSPDVCHRPESSVVPMCE